MGLRKLKNTSNNQEGPDFPRVFEEERCLPLLDGIGLKESGRQKFSMEFARKIIEGMP